MLLVRTYVQRSSIHGLGLFAAQFIPIGTVIWTFAEGVDQSISADRVRALDNPARKSLMKYAYLNLQRKCYILCADDARFLNHSDDPNIESTKPDNGEEGSDIACRDIQAGEELTTNYREFDADMEIKLSRLHRPRPELHAQ